MHIGSSPYTKSNNNMALSILFYQMNGSSLQNDNYIKVKFCSYKENLTKKIIHNSNEIFIFIFQWGTFAKLVSFQFNATKNFGGVFVSILVIHIFFWMDHFSNFWTILVEEETSSGSVHTSASKKAEDFFFIADCIWLVLNWWFDWSESHCCWHWNESKDE